MSEIRATTVSNLAGTGPVTLTGQYAAKAWVNFKGTGTVAIRQSENVSSITDNGTGSYTVNFTVAMTDADYVAIAMGSWDQGSYIAVPIIEWDAGSRLQTKTTSAFGLRTWHTYNEFYYDGDEVQLSVTR